MPPLRRYSLRTLVIAVSIVTVWIGVVTQRARWQRQAVEAVLAEGGRVEYAHQFKYSATARPIPITEVPNAKPPGAPWLRQLLGDDVFVSPLTIWHIKDLSHLDRLHSVEHVYGAVVTEENAKQLSSLKRLKVLMLNQASSLEDFSFLEDCPHLVHFSGNRTTFGDDDAVHLRSLQQLQWLQLQGTETSDEALEVLGELPQLEFLNLAATNVTDKGVKSIAACRRLERLSLSGTAVTDASIELMATLPSLKEVSLDDTAVTYEGLKPLLRKKGLVRLSARNAQGGRSREFSPQPILPQVYIDPK